LKNPQQPELKAGGVVAAKVFFAKRTQVENGTNANNRAVQSGFWPSKPVRQTNPNEPKCRIKPNPS
jgi:hypothetical protein